MPLINTKQQVIRDTIPPTLVVGGGVSPRVSYGSNAFISGLLAYDEGKDITGEIQTDVDYHPNVFVEGGNLDVEFYVTDKGGNTVYQTVNISVIGSPKFDTPVLYDFSNLAEIPEELVAVNGTWGLLDGYLVPTGSEPSSPRWNIVTDSDGYADIQIEYKQSSQNALVAILLRMTNSTNFTWLRFQNGELALRSRVNGSDSVVASTTIPYTFDPEQLINLGARADGENITVYFGEEEVFTAVSTDRITGRQFGILNVEGDVSVSKMMIGGVNSLNFGSYDSFLIKPIVTVSPSYIGYSGELTTVRVQSTPGTNPISHFVWSSDSSGEIVLDSSTTNTVSFLAPNVDESKTYTLKVQAVDTMGNKSEMYDVTVVIQPEELPTDFKVVVPLKAKIFSVNYLSSSIPPPICEIQAGSDGVVLEVEISSYDNVSKEYKPLSVAEAVNYTILVKKPDGVLVTKLSQFTTDGKDGKIQAVMEPEDIDIDGTYKVQVILGVNGWSGKSTVSKFEVHDNLG